MEQFKLCEFDPWIDGNMNFAKQIVSFYRDSSNFTLKNWKLKDDFFNLFIGKFDEYCDNVLDYYHIEYNDDNLEIDLGILNIRNTLVNLHQEGKLKPCHFIPAYVNIFFRYKSIPLPLLKNYDIKIIFDGFHQDKIYEYFIFYGEKYHDLVPFISKNGIFGMNTYLYLYFNGIFPVASSFTPYDVHNKIFSGQIDVMVHDIIHYSVIKDFEIKNQDIYPQYLQKLKNIYELIFKDNLPIDQKKMFIFLIFLVLHESLQILDCNDPIKWYNFDMFKLYKNNKYYSPESLGFDNNEITVENKDITISFINKVLENVTKDFCQKYYN